MSVSADFIFTVSQVGAELALKEELAARGLRPGFSRPGFVTFKRAEAEWPVTLETELGAVFARAYGLSLGQTRGRAEDRVAEVRARVAALGATRIHLFAREKFAPGEEPKDFVAGAWTRAARAELAALAPELAARLGPAEADDLVLDVIVLEPDDWWLGAHRQGPGHSPFPGGDPELVLPAEAPSRAWLKLEEALSWSRAPVRAGDRALEIGAAPGGAAWALLARGLTVYGADPGEMDPRVLAHPAFTHLRAQVGVLGPEAYPSDLHWVVLDMNTRPEIAFQELERVLVRVRGALLGVILTLKLNDWAVARLVPEYLEHLRRLGFGRLRATQLPHNRQEICVVGLTPRALLRRAGSGSGSDPTPARKRH